MGEALISMTPLQDGSVPAWAPGWPGLLPGLAKPHGRSPSRNNSVSKNLLLCLHPSGNDNGTYLMELSCGSKQCVGSSSLRSH